MLENKLSEEQIEDLAKEMVGDGQSPNKWFVSTSPWIVYYIPNDTEPYTKLLDDTTSESKSIYGPFDTYEAALECYNNIDLDSEDGIGQVFIEDRLTGTVKEKWLEEKMTVKYIQQEYSDYSNLR